MTIARAAEYANECPVKAITMKREEE